MKADDAYRGVQVIVGLTSDRPKESKGNKTVEVEACDPEDLYKH